jgi:hypothetical protein
VWTFAGAVGGVLGLWLGFSMLTILEFFELGIDLLVVWVANMRRRMRGESTDAVQPFYEKKATHF